MPSFSEYIRGIIFFLVFASFVGIILPEGKYKSYIHIVIGFVVMFLVFEPVVGISDTVERMSLQLTQTALSETEVAEPDDDASSDAEARTQEWIAEAFRSQMREQLTRALAALDYEITALGADIDLETGELRSIDLTLAKPTETGITITPVKIGADSEPVQQDAAVENIKNIVSDFYQIQAEHIHVTIQ